eukprot:gene2531-biopygen8021
MSCSPRGQPLPPSAPPLHTHVHATDAILGGTAKQYCELVRISAAKQCEWCGKTVRLVRKTVRLVRKTVRISAFTAPARCQEELQ